MGMMETVPAVNSEIIDALEEPPRSPQVPLLARIPLATALRFCGLFLVMWIVGNWFAELQKSLRGLHIACEVVAGCGCLLFVASSYVAIRAWQLRHPR